ncbi:MAG: ornithine carbamoyltransferase [Acidimicrobiales bacterium]
MTGTRHLLDVTDLSVGELDEVVALAEATELPAALAGAGVALVFEKPSLRTRSATEMAVVSLGGHPVFIGADEVGIDRRETAEDVARTLGCFHRVLCARVLDHGTLVRMASALDEAGAGVPVVNLLSDRSHPAQAVADLLTLRQVLRTSAGTGASIAGRAVAYVGDANNVCVSLAEVLVMSGAHLKVASPEGYGLGHGELERLRRLATAAGRDGSVVATDDPAAAVGGADAVYTDVWTSMGQEAEAVARRRAFGGYTLDQALLDRAAPGAVVLHCLPAHRGEEITDEVLEGGRSVVWRQAANRRGAMRGLLAWLVGVRPCG